jgi:hypothetical protein
MQHIFALISNQTDLNCGKNFDLQLALSKPETESFYATEFPQLSGAEYHAYSIARNGTACALFRGWLNHKKVMKDLSSHYYKAKTMIVRTSAAAISSSP